MLTALGGSYVLLSGADCPGFCDDKPNNYVCGVNQSGGVIARCQGGDCKSSPTPPPVNRCGGGDVGESCSTPAGDTGNCVMDGPNNVIFCGVVVP